jgi:hypothetical protein
MANPIRSKSKQGVTTLPAESPGRMLECAGNGVPREMVAARR